MSGQRRAAVPVGWAGSASLPVTHPCSPCLARPTEQGEPPWLTPGSPSPMKATGAWLEPGRSQSRKSGLLLRDGSGKGRG